MTWRATRCGQGEKRGHNAGHAEDASKLTNPPSTPCTTDISLDEGEQDLA